MVGIRVSVGSNRRLSMAGISADLVSVAVQLLVLVLASPAPVNCGEDNDPDWYSRSAEMINAQPPDNIYTRGRGHAYLGIPYGMPSNDTNAFKVPQEINPYKDYTNQVNLDFGPYCPQMVEVPGMPDRNFFIGQQDCLTLNVIHPLPPNATRKYPVYVVLHPGWLLRGTARDFGIQGIVHNLVARAIVVVTVEYRLGTYGLFNFGTGAEGDSLRSLYDVIAALQWVNLHIHNFAGNKSAVTLGGWGDGGACLASWLVIAATNTSKGLSHLFQQADVHGGSAELCWLHFYSDAGRKWSNASQVIAKDLCPAKTGNSLRKCIKLKCACTTDIWKEVCNKKTQRCTEAALTAAKNLSLPLATAQMEEPDGGMFPVPPFTVSFRNIFLEASQRHKMRILMGWTRDEFAAIQPATRAKRYDKEYLSGEFFKLAHLTSTSTNNVSHAFGVVVNYYLSLYSLNEATMGESEWYRLYIRFMSDFLFRIMGCEDGSLWAIDGHTVLFYQFDAEPAISFMPVVDATARKFNAPTVGHLADLPYVFMAEQYFKPGEHNIAGALDKQPMLGEWNLANVMGRMMADFVWQRPTGTYFRPLERCELFPGDVTILHTPWVSHISRNGGIARPVLTSIPMDLIKTWSDILEEFFSAGQNFTVLAPVPDWDHSPCLRVDASNVTDPP